MRLPFGWMLFRMSKKRMLSAKVLVAYPQVGIEEPLTGSTVSVACSGGIEVNSNGKVCVKVALRFSDILHALLYRQTKGEESDGS